MAQQILIYIKTVKIVIEEGVGREILYHQNYFTTFFENIFRNFNWKTEKQRKKECINYLRFTVEEILIPVNRRGFTRRVH